MNLIKNITSYCNCSGIFLYNTSNRRLSSLYITGYASPIADHKPLRIVLLYYKTSFSND